MFAFEPDVVHVFGRVTFGAAGAPTLDTNNSKGICNFAGPNVYLFTGNTASSTTISVVSSFLGLYPGMTITGAGIPASTTISSINAGAGTMVISQAATATATGVALSASGGTYTVTFGSQFTPFKRLDAYNKLLNLTHIYDESGLPGSATTQASSAYASTILIVQNNISNANLANIVLQFGGGTGAGFLASNPANGEALRLGISLCRSGAI